MAEKLNLYSQGVVHATPGRTRLRLPSDYRSRDVLRELEQHVQTVEGVKYAEYNEKTGSIVIYHEADDDILERIGASMAKYNPTLFAIIVAPRPEPAPSKVLSFFQRGKEASTTDGGTSDTPFLSAGSLFKKALPMAIVAVGAFQLIERKTLLAALPPLGLIFLVYELQRHAGDRKPATKPQLRSIGKDDDAT